MFSTKLNEDRYVVPCIILTSAPIVHTFVVDTGAKYTCCSINNVNPDLEEDTFIEAEYKLIGGLVEGGSIKYYKMEIKQFTIGTLNLGTQSIWVTFDERATDDVLGMDILKGLYFMHHREENSLLFSLDSKEIKNVLD